VRVATIDDLRETLELHVMEMQELGVADSSIRRYVNSSLKATVDKDGYRSTPFLRKYWARLHETPLSLVEGRAESG
jgi:hypothetical protein